MNVKVRQYFKVKYKKLFQYQRQLFGVWRHKRLLKKVLTNDPKFKTKIKDKAYLTSAQHFLKQNLLNFKNTDWHHYYSCLNGIQSPEYIPDGLFFPKIEPVLNPYPFSFAYSDKVAYDVFIPANNSPKTIFKILWDSYYDDENNLIEKEQALSYLKKIKNELVLKPTINSGGGLNIVIDSGTNIADLLLSKKFSSESYILQEKIKQHPEMAKFHPSSLNTCKIMTARIQSEIVIIGAFMRMGRFNAKIDNGKKGGLACQVFSDGSISEFALDTFNNRFDRHPDTGLTFHGFKVPNYEKAKEFCISQHKRFMRFSLISWDIGIKNDGNPVFIEYNLKRQAIDWLQVFNGPLFGEHTSFLLKKYAEEKDICSL